MNHIRVGFYRHLNKVVFVDRDYADDERHIQVKTRDGQTNVASREVLIPFLFTGQEVELSHDHTKFYPYGWTNSGIEAIFVHYSETGRAVFRLPDGKYVEASPTFYHGSDRILAPTTLTSFDWGYKLFRVGMILLMASFVSALLLMFFYAFVGLGYYFIPFIYTLSWVAVILCLTGVLSGLAIMLFSQLKRNNSMPFTRLRG